MTAGFDGDGEMTALAVLGDDRRLLAGLVGFGAGSPTWGLLAETLDQLSGDGVIAIEGGDTVAYINLRFRELFGLVAGIPVVGTPLSRLLGRFGEHGMTVIGAGGAPLTGWPVPNRQDGPVVFQVGFDDGRVYRVSGRRLSNGGVAYGCSDLFDRRAAREQLRRANKAAAINLATMAEFWDGDLGDHLYRVARMTAEITTQLYRRRRFVDVIDERFREEVTAASILHDIGKFAVPESVVRKPGRLTDDEMERMKTHTTAGAQLLERSARLWDATGYLVRGAEIARYHHERCDGSGYPEGLKGDAIPVAARIVAVADVYDALISERTYKPAWEPERAAAHIVEGRGTLFDPQVVDAFREVLANRAERELFPWTDVLSVGIPAIDRDHRILVGLVNQLAVAEDRQDRINLEEVLDELVSYTLYHFDREERLLAAVGYPDLADHARRHHELAERVLMVRRRFFAVERDRLGDEVLEFLVSWLRGHILGEDRKYIPYLTGTARS